LPIYHLSEEKKKRRNAGFLYIQENWRLSRPCAYRSPIAEIPFRQDTILIRFHKYSKKGHSHSMEKLSLSKYGLLILR